MWLPTKQGEAPAMSRSLTFSTPFSVLQARRAVGLDISDHIRVTVAGPDDVRSAVQEDEQFMSHEVLADSVVLASPRPEGFAGQVGLHEITVEVVRA